MNKRTFDEMRLMLPELGEIRPILDHLLGESAPDDERQWAGSGELGTSGSRLVDIAALRESLNRLVSAEQAHIEQVFGHVVEAAARFADGDAEGAAGEFLALAALEEMNERADRAAAYADAACRAAQEGSDSRLMALALRRRARSRLALGEHEEAEKDYSRAQGLALAAGDVRGHAEGAIGAGNVLEEQGRWEGAEKWYILALDALKDEDTQPVEAWHASLNLHVVMRSRGRLEESLAPLTRAEEIAGQIGDESARPFIENARGQWHMADGGFEDAISHLKTAVDAASGARASVTIRVNLAEALLAAGRPLDAAEEARVAEREAIIARLGRKLPEVYRLLGTITAGQDNPDAFVLFERALEIIEARRMPRLERAITLQAYADAEGRVGTEETSQRLRGLADQLYHELGIEHRRSAWADHYGSDTEHDVV
jgi:tetratricopeptide (TPR) repeat protein